MFSSGRLLLKNLFENLINLIYYSLFRHYMRISSTKLIGYTLFKNIQKKQTQRIIVRCDTAAFMDYSNSSVIFTIVI